MSAPPPSDTEIVRCLEGALTDRGGRAGVGAIERRPYPYATSFALEEVVARLDDGRTLRLILKDLTWDRLLGDAGGTKPRFLYEPRRCIDTYRTVLADRGLGPAFYGAVVDDERHRYWFLMEKVPGVELWQIGDVATWEAAARWLARFHGSFADEVTEVSRRNPHLLRYGPELLRQWPGRALQAVDSRGVGAAERHRLKDLASRYDTVVERLATVPPTFVHGELYPSNVLVDDVGPEVRVWPIDWEMAGVGPALLDLAALTAGWHGPEQAKLVDAYLDEVGPEGWCRGRTDVAVLLDCCRLHYAFQWLGWSVDWTPPPEHARDWVAEALALGERLGL